MPLRQRCLIKTSHQIRRDNIHYMFLDVKGIKVVKQKWATSFTVNVKILMLIKWLNRYSQLCWLLSLEWLSYFEHVVHSLLNTYLLVFILRTRSNHILLKQRCPIKTRYQIRAHLLYMFLDVKTIEGVTPKVDYKFHMELGNGFSYRVQTPLTWTYN